MKSISIRQTRKNSHQTKSVKQSLNSYRTLIRLLETTSPGERNHSTVTLISDEISKLHFFTHIPRFDVENLAQHIQYRHMREHQIILREGDEGKAFYVIFHGRACVYKLDKAPISAGDELFSTDAEDDIYNGSSSSDTEDSPTKGQGSVWLRANNERAADNDELQLQKTYGGFITALIKDDTFGEISISDNVMNA